MAKKNETKPTKEQIEEFTRKLRRQAHRYLDRVEQYKLTKPEFVIIDPGASEDVISIIAKAFKLGVADTESIKTVKFEKEKINLVYLRLSGVTMDTEKVIKSLPEFVNVIAALDMSHESLVIISREPTTPAE